MSAQTNDGHDDGSLEARLKALDSRESAGGQRAWSKVSPVAVLGGLAGLGLLGGLLYVAAQPEAKEQMQTSVPAEFQPEGDSFGQITPTPVVQPTPAPEIDPKPQPTAAPNAALLERIDQLQAEIESLRDAPAEEDDSSAQDARTEALLARIDTMQESNEEAQAALERQLADRDRALRRLQADLDLARLGAAGGAPAPAGLGPNAEEQRRLAELERRRQEARDFQLARSDSGIIAFGGGGQGESASQDPAGRRLDAGTAFVRNGAATAEVTQAEAIANPSHTVPQGTLIQASLETAVDSSTPGQVRALVSESVYAYDGSRVLIPRGARLIGRYQSGAEIAQKRITIAWDRILLPSGQTVEISAFGGDALGRAGVGGVVDTRFEERLGAAALITLISAGASYGAGQIEDESAAGAADRLGRDVETAADGALNDAVSLGPVIHVAQGARVTVMVDRDLEIY